MMAPAPRPRFRIDPREAPAQPPEPPPATAPAVVASAPTPAAARPRRRRAWLAWGAVGVVVLLAGAAVAVLAFGVGGFTYPKKYLLASSESPSGVVISPPDQLDRDSRWQANKNPSEFTADGLDSLQREMGARPTDAWVEVFDTPQQSGSIVVVSAKFASADDADGAVQRAAAACNAGTTGVTLLQDGGVVVVVRADSIQAQAYADRVVQALHAKASGLKLVCRG